MTRFSLSFHAMSPYPKELAGPRQRWKAWGRVGSSLEREPLLEWRAELCPPKVRAGTLVVTPVPTMGWYLKTRLCRRN